MGGWVGVCERERVRLGELPLFQEKDMVKGNLLGATSSSNSCWSRKVSLGKFPGY